MQLNLIDTPTDINSLDQYYTKEEVAKKCITRLISVLKDTVDINDYLFFEPSAGYGCFYDGVKEMGYPIIAFDMEPRHREIKKLDFLDQHALLKKLKELKKIKNKKVMVIGNPPFGKRSKLAIQFFNQATCFADTIAFILPNQFKKYTVHKELIQEFHLIDEMDLPPNSFYTITQNEQTDYHVNCLFQIWTKLNTPYPDKRIRNKPRITHGDFKMFQYNNTQEARKALENDFDFAVFCQGYGDYKTFITKREDFDYKKHYILFKCRNKNVEKKLKKIDFEKLSRQNTTVPGFRKNNVVTEYMNQYGG